MPRPGIFSRSAPIVTAAVAILSAGSARSATAQAIPAPVSAGILHTTRVSPSDLEVGGELARLPQVSYTVTDDPNFKRLGPTRVSGVSLEELAKRFAAPNATLVVAICNDKYRGNYARDYRAAHQPLLVLKINGQGPAEWSKDAGNDMGPYLISHPKFTPRFKVLSQAEEAQIPWGVVRLELRNEKQVFGAIAPRGSHANEPAVQDGYRIAEQNCFRCHNMDGAGGEKSGVTWVVLSALAAGSPDFFTAYVRDPKTKNPNAQMPGNPDYDDATIQALAAYFRTFAPAEKKEVTPP
jgi:mono/diheme cytochrome c family protein